MFSGVRTLHDLPGVPRLSAEHAALKFLIQSNIAFRSGPAQLKMISEFLKVAVTDSPLVRKLSTINALCASI